jgi:hypothetical protein
MFFAIIILGTTFILFSAQEMNAEKNVRHHFLKLLYGPLPFDLQHLKGHSHKKVVRLL